MSEIPQGCLKSKGTSSEIQASIISEAPSGGMTIKVENGPGWICVRDWFLDGWRCYDSSGERMKIVEAEGGLMAVYSEKENDMITFKFHPPGLVSGIILSALGLILLAGYCTLNRVSPANQKDSECTRNRNQKRKSHGNKGET